MRTDLPESSLQEGRWMLSTREYSGPSRMGRASMPSPCVNCLSFTFLRHDSSIHRVTRPVSILYLPFLLSACVYVMPTLLDLAGVPIPESVEGVSLATDVSRQYLYGEHYEDERASRMIRDDRFKLIYYPVGNRGQLFDMKSDPRELEDLSERASCGEVRERLAEKLIEYLYGSDLEWIEGGTLKGLPDREFTPRPHRALNDQRGWRFM